MDHQCIGRVEMGQVEETPIKFSSREAGDLHRGMAAVVVASSDMPVVVETHGHGSKLV
jgi:hypothetical protein